MDSNLRQRIDDAAEICVAEGERADIDPTPVKGLVGLRGERANTLLR